MFSFCPGRRLFWLSWYITVSSHELSVQYWTWFYSVCHLQLPTGTGSVLMVVQKRVTVHLIDILCMLARQRGRLQSGFNMAVHRTKYSMKPSSCPCGMLLLKQEQGFIGTQQNKMCVTYAKNRMKGCG